MISSLVNPTRFMKVSGRVLPWLAAMTAIIVAGGLCWALAFVPPDCWQGGSVRIMFIHVPSAWLALQTYLFVAGASAVALVWRHPLAEVAAQEAAPIGAAFTLVCLVTGSLWGRPMWGTWWVWDVRLTSVLILFFLYLGYVALVNAFDDPTRGGRAGSILAVVGVVILPIIKFSVETWWWRVFDWWGLSNSPLAKTLHQPASVVRPGGPTIDASMLVPLLIMAVGFTLMFATLLLVRMRAGLNERRVRALVMRGVGNGEAMLPTPRPAMP
jgi:heme exporter protein C